MGKSIDQAIVNAVAAMRDLVEVMLEAGETLPAPREGASIASVPLIREKGKPTKANLSLDSSLLETIDAEAKRLALTRSAFVEMIVRHSLPQLAWTRARRTMPVSSAWPGLLARRFQLS